MADILTDTRRMPFTEIVERVQKDLARDNSAAEAKYWGLVNDVYMYDIPTSIDYRHIRTEANLLTTADYSTGNISLTSGTTITGAATSWTSANSNNLLLKVDGYDEIYRMTYVSGTSLTADRAWVGTNISANTTYRLYQDRYALSTGFDRTALDPDKTVWRWSGGTRQYLLYKSPEEFEEVQTATIGEPQHYTVKWISGDPYLFLDPPDTKARSIHYIYIPQLVKIDESTAGTILTLANESTAVTGTSTVFDDAVTDTSAYDYYFRIDGDGTGAASVWYKVASQASATSLTLSTAYKGTALSSATAAYTISKVSLLPAGIDAAIMYGAAMTSGIDQGSPTQAKSWSSMYEKIVTQYKAVEGKKGYGKQRVRTIYERPGARR